MRIDFDKDELNLISECIYLAVCDDEMSSQLLKCLDLNQAKLNRISISVREKLQYALKKNRELEKQQKMAMYVVRIDNYIHDVFKSYLKSLPMNVTRQEFIEYYEKHGLHNLNHVVGE